MVDGHHEPHAARFGAGTGRARAPGNPFAGRAAELTLLRSILDDPVPQATLVSVAGEPGIGKSRLITESLRDTGRHVLAAGSAEVVHRVLLERIAAGQDVRRRSLRAVGAGSPFRVPADDAGSLHTGVAELVTAPSVLVLDDLHLADATVLAFVQAVVTHPPAVPLVLLAGYRPGTAPAALLGTLAGGAAAGTVTEIVLGPLGGAAIGELTELDAADDRLPAVLADSAGNPRWAQFAVGAAAVDVAVRAELAVLETRQQAVLRSLAVLGVSAEVSQLAAMHDAEHGLGTVLGELTGTGLVVHHDRTATLRFRHPRVRELVYAGIDPATKAAAHRHAARVLTESGAPEEARAEQLEHLGSDLDEADVRTLVDAAGEVLWRRPAAAARWLDAALRSRRDRWPAGTGRDEARILLGQAQVLAGDLPAGRATLQEVLAGLSEIDPARRWQAAAAGGLVERFLGRYPEAARVLVGAAEWLPAGEAMLGFAVEHGAIALLDNHYADVAEHVDDAARTSGRAAPGVRAAVLTMAGLGAASQLDVETAGAHLDEAAALVDAASDVLLLDSVETLSRLAWGECYLERFADASRHFRRGIELAEGSGQAVLLPQLLLGQAQLLSWTGSLPAAQRVCARALALAEDSGSPAIRGFALALTAQMQTWSSECGASAHAVATAEQAVACSDRHTLWGQTAAALLACAQVMAGRPEQCVATFLELSGGPELTEAQPMYRALYYRTMTGASVLAGDVAAAEEWARRTEETACDQLAGHRAFRACARADVLAAQGRMDEALELYRTAVQEFDACDWALQRDWTAAACGTLLTKFGRPAEAGEWLRRGKAGAARHGVVATAGLADAALRVVELAEPEPASAAVLRVLTPRQREIVELVIAGRSNRDIAGRLSLSARTVESHLANAYRSMGISSRAELLNAAAGHRIRPLTGEPQLPVGFDTTH